MLLCFYICLFIFKNLIDSIFKMDIVGKLVLDDDGIKTAHKKYIDALKKH